MLVVVRHLLQSERPIMDWFQVCKESEKRTELQKMQGGERFGVSAVRSFLFVLVVHFNFTFRSDCDVLVSCRFQRSLARALGQA